MTTSNVTSNNEMTPRRLVIVIRKLLFCLRIGGFGQLSNWTFGQLDKDYRVVGQIKSWAIRYVDKKDIPFKLRRIGNQTFDKRHEKSLFEMFQVFDDFIVCSAV